MMATINGIEFKTKKSLEEYVRSEVKNFVPENPLWSELLLRHPEKDLKIGCGIKTFKREIDYQSKQYYLKVVRLDGTEIDFSWRVCVHQNAKTEKDNLVAAMRLAINDQIKDFRNDYPDQCVLCKKVLDGRYHVDHVVFFKTLVKDFLKTTKLPVPTKFDDHYQAHCATFKKEDLDFEKEWWAYHLNNAELRAVCIGCNLRRSKK